MIIQDEQYLSILDLVKEYSRNNPAPSEEFLNKIRTVMDSSARDVFGQLQEEKLIYEGIFGELNRPELKTYITDAGLSMLGILKKKNRRKKIASIISIATLLVAILSVAATIYFGCTNTKNKIVLTTALKKGQILIPKTQSLLSDTIKVQYTDTLNNEKSQSVAPAK